MIPYLKFYIASNPNFNQPIEPVIPPTREEWEVLVSYEPTKISSSYDEYVATYTVRETASRASSALTHSIIKKIAVDESNHDDIIEETEKLDEFIRWVD